MEISKELIYIKTETDIIPLRANRILAVYVLLQITSPNVRRFQYKIQYLYKDPGRARQVYTENGVSERQRNKLEKQLPGMEFEPEIIFCYGTLYIRWNSIPRLTRSWESAYNFVRRVFN